MNRSRNRAGRIGRLRLRRGNEQPAGERARRNNSHPPLEGPGRPVRIGRLLRLAQLLEDRPEETARQGSMWVPRQEPLTAGNASVMMLALQHTSCDHAVGNYRMLTKR